MARIRTIKPSFWAHETLSALPAPVHMLAAALLNVCDDAGYFLAHPALVKAATMPLREDLDADDALARLAAVGYIRLGRLSDGRRVGCVVTFRDHQRVDRPTASKLEALAIRWDDGAGGHGGAPASRAVEPTPSASPRGAAEASPSDPETLAEASTSEPRDVAEGSAQEGKGREGNKEEEGKASAARDVREAVLDGGSPAPEPARPRTLEARVAEKRARPLVSGGASPLGYGLAHGDHEAGFCGWQCLPVELVTEFATGLASACRRGEFSANDVESARLEVLEWALKVRRAFEASGRPPAARSCFEFWRRRWAERYPDGSGADRRATGHGDAVGGLRDAIAAVTR